MNNSAKHCKATNKNAVIYMALTAFLILSVFLGLLLGSTSLSVSEIFKILTGGNVSASSRNIFIYVRLPRVCATVFCGAALAVSGAVIQGVLANRLASPSIIGVNSGAGLAVTVCTALGLYGGWQLSAFSFIGALVTVLLVSAGARKWGASRGTVVLIGVALNSLLNAISETVMTLNPDVRIFSSDFKIGEFSSVTYQRLLPAAIIIAVALAVLFTLTHELDVLSLGEENAKGLGLNTKVMRTVFMILAALLAGCAVSLAGLLSFVGLIVPHITRKIAGGQACQLLSMSALLGAGFVTLCDTVARTVASPYEIPVGIIMSFLGVPFFIFILIKGKGGHARD